MKHLKDLCGRKPPQSRSQLLSQEGEKKKEHSNFLQTLKVSKRHTPTKVHKQGRQAAQSESAAIQTPQGFIK